MKKGFTLVELLVVVVVIITLMAITFRLAGVASDSNCRNITIERMQRLENALSGYYAAFGSYPPVDLYAKRNYKLRVEDDRVDQGNDEWSGRLADNWHSVEAACRAQPLAARFPFDTKLQPYVTAVSRLVAERANSNDERWSDYQKNRKLLGAGFTAICGNPNQFSGWDKYSSWQDVQIFQFGVMSFLLPRYLFMLSGITDLNNLQNCAQWTANNRLSANPNNGIQFNNWDNQLKYKSLIQRIPSQSVCARWMPNLENIVACTGNPKLFDISIRDARFGGGLIASPKIIVFSNGSTRYVLDSMTVYDGWKQEFYYYSPPPYQSYRLWSAGANGMTFPPWTPLESINDDADRETAAAWIADDIMFMSN